MIDGAIGRGSPEPLGVRHDGDGIDVAVVSAHATAVDFCVFDAEDREVARVRLPGRTGDVFHGRIEGVAVGTRYGLRVDGPWAPERGHRFNPAKLVIDPHASAFDRPFKLHPTQFDARARGEDADAIDSAAFVPKAIVQADAAPTPVTRPRVAPVERVIYEAHVRGLTRLHPDVPEAVRGTFAGLGAPATIAHLKRLGITVLEVMPIWAGIDERHLGPLGLTNYWNYNPIAPMAVCPRLAPGGWPEVRAAVDALHAAGIQVILDVVLNHTGESDHLGPTIAWRGLDNALYYRLREDDPSRYVDDAGCGNVPALDRQPVLRLALDALRHAATVGGFDGFRYDLATTTARRSDGFDPASPFLTAVQQDPILRDLVHVAEPWDIGPGGYRLGAFPAGWGEWNDRWRDTMRRFWRGETGLVGDVATRFAGSSDVFWSRRRPASDSVNYVTAHDGFTLADLVSHSRKHNRANGENDRDGSDANHSWNHGIEGESDDPGVKTARARDVRALLATLLTSRGTPMLSMGDELGRTQHGNNNAYAQDNEISWVDWARADEGLIDFTRRLIELRRAHPALNDDRPPTGTPIDDSGIVDVAWTTLDGHPFTAGHWHDPENFRLVAVFAARGANGTIDRVAVVMSVDPHPAVMVPPPARPGMGWRLALDSAHPDRPVEWGRKFAVDGRSITVVVEEPIGDEGRARPTDSATLDRLARAAGISPDWWDLSGACTRVGDDTKRAILASMGLPADTLGEARDGLERLIDETSRRALPRSHTIFLGDAPELPIAGAAAQGGRSLALTIEVEGGAPRRVVVQPGEGRLEQVTTADGRVVARRFVRLPDLPIGRHVVVLDGGEISTRLTVAPRACHLPARLIEGGRVFGIASHLYTLRRPGDQGVGDFTALADLARASAEAGAATVGINPIHALFPGDRERASPYSPSDRRFLDPIYIDVDRLPRPLAAGFGPEAPRSALEFSRLTAGSHLDWTGVWRAKEGLLRGAFSAFTALEATHADDPLVADYRTFVAAGGEGLARFATFEAIAAVTGTTTASGFPAELARHDGWGVADFAARHGRVVKWSMFLQWLAARQFADAARVAREAGLGLGFYRDLAVGCAPDGAEAWGAGARLMRGVSVGAPPDPFAPDGQVWSLPPPNPVESARSGHAAFAELVRANMAHAGVLRIDHVLGLRRLFVVPDGMTGGEGAYVDQPFEDLIGQLTLESARAACMVVGEDLGTVPWGFRERMAEARVLSYQVVWFEREGRGFRSPQHYPPLGTAVVATHDLPTLAGWWSATDIDDDVALGRIAAADEGRARADRAEEKRIMVDTLIGAGLLPPFSGEVPLEGALTPEIAGAIHAFASRGKSMLTFVQVDDLSGETERLNLPGTDRERPNWRRRLSATVAGLFRGPLAEAILAGVADRRGDDAQG